MDKRAEYEQLASLERETTQMRHTTFTALISISFIVPGFASQGSDSAPTIEFFGRSTNVSELAFLLGFFFYIFTVVHYTWYHRYSHMYRSALKKLEVELGIEVYRLRVRPRIGRMT